MSELARARVEDHLLRLRLHSVATRLDAVLTRPGRSRPTSTSSTACFARSSRPSRSGASPWDQIAHFPVVKTLEELDFKFQPSIDSKLVRELATGHFLAQAENVLLFGPSGVGTTHLAIALGRTAIESGHTALFVTATVLIAALARAHAEGHLAAS